MKGTALLPPAVVRDRKLRSTSLFPVAAATGVEPWPAFHRDLWCMGIKTGATERCYHIQAFCVVQRWTETGCKPSVYFHKRLQPFPVGHIFN